MPVPVRFSYIVSLVLEPGISDFVVVGEIELIIDYCPGFWVRVYKIVATKAKCTIGVIPGSITFRVFLEEFHVFFTGKMPFGIIPNIEEIFNS